MIYPIFIPSRGRYDINDGQSVAYRLSTMGVEEYRFIVEADERQQYADRYGSDRVLVMPQSYKDQYDTCDTYGDRFGMGSGPPRNFAWDVAVEEDSPWHWTMDDNICTFNRFVQNRRVVAKDGHQFFSEAESMIVRWKNVGLGGLHAKPFVVPGNAALKGATINTRIYSCILTRTDMPFRWRSRYNEDTVLCIDVLKARYATVLLNRWLMAKAETQSVKGGNTDTIYRHGTGTKSRLLVRIHPDVCKLMWRFGRYHHHVNYRAFADVPLIADPDFGKTYPDVDFSKHFGYMPSQKGM